jgi:hypothetical protein
MLQAIKIERFVGLQIAELPNAVILYQFRKEMHLYCKNCGFAALCFPYL